LKAFADEWILSDEDDDSRNCYARGSVKRPG
jgi:hypothetical protein